LSIVDTLKLAAVAAREGGRLAADGLPGAAGNAMPYRAAEVATPAILSGLINDYALVPFDSPVNITAIRRQDIPSVSSNCHNLVLSLQQAAPAGLPDSVFVKLPMESVVTRWFFSIIDSWRLESHFFRHVARDLPLRTPT
jgi:hypothetical protein